MLRPITRAWPGSTVHILAGGPSLVGRDFSKFIGRRVIAINKSAFDWPNADVLFFADRRFLSNYIADILAFPNEVITTIGGAAGERFHQVQKVPHPPLNGQRPTLALDRQCVAMDRTSLQGAINVAAHKGGKRIVLHGADMKFSADGRRHHHEEYPKGWEFGDDWQANFIADLAGMVEPLAALGIQVVNANPDSDLPHWPKCSFEAAFE